MPTATKLSSKKPARKRAAKQLPAHGIKAAPGNPFAGLEHVLGSIALPPDPRPPREIIPARILATTKPNAKRPAPKASRRTSARSPKAGPVSLKFPDGHPFAGIESAFGSVSIPVPPVGPKRRAYIRARILADHNT